MNTIPPLRILFVEDMPADAELAERELHQEEISFVSIRVDTEKEFLKALESFKPDLVISDYSMPEFDGMEALKLSLQHDATLPVVILTGSMNEETAVECMKAGAADYVIKEHISRLPFAVKGALERKKIYLAKLAVEEALRISEERFRVALQNSPFIVATTDQELRYTWIHSPYLKHKIEDFIGKRDDEIDDSPGAKKLLNIKRQVLITGHGLRSEVQVPEQDRILTYDITAEPLLDAKGQVVGVTTAAVDITERKRYENELKYLSLHDQLTGLYNRAYYEEELQRLSDSREYPITIIVADLDGLKLINDSFGHQKGDELLIGCAYLLKLALRQSDVLARVGGDEFSIILPRTEEDTGELIIKRIKKQIDLYNQKNSDLPLSLSLGVATTYGKETTLHQLYKEADDLMYRDKLYRGNSARSQIISALLAALAERDFITEGHARRLAEMSQKVGEKMGLSAKQIADLLLFSQVHDLGKVGIPDNILLSSGPLSKDEWSIMQQHPEKGYRIANSTPDLISVANLILKHHERWDGTGYPWRLKGLEIPIECRILLVIDAYDAMTSDRPYSKAMSKEDALAEIKSCSGTQFDPEVVKVFLSIIEEE